MNKVQVGFAPSPNLKTVHSKIGSLGNANYKPGGGNVKIESQKLKIEAKPRVGARNENYSPSGGDVKVINFSQEKKTLRKHDFSIQKAPFLISLIFLVNLLCVARAT